MNGSAPPTLPAGRRFAQGAEIIGRGVHFRVWAPGHSQVDLVLAAADAPRIVALTREAEGYWSTFVAGLGTGASYQYRLDGQGPDLPDPVSRFLPDGPHGASQVVDPGRFPWTDRLWTGLSLSGQVIYELHLGTFTPEGTWRGAAAKLEALRALGVTVVEVMPVAEFPGRFGWGYDGVSWFAPSRLYGSPDDFRFFVDRAHQLQLGVILDVVYNHLGPDGNFLDRFSPYYGSDQHNEWGRAMNFDGEHSAAVRTLVGDNAAYWIDEFHLDGLRLDATQSICDRSDDHIIGALVQRARDAAGGRRLLIVGESEPQNTRLLQAVEAGGMGLDALWNDDFHHSALVSLTGRRQAYFSDYQGTASEWIAAAKRGFLFQGQRSAWQAKRRGHPVRGLPPTAFVAFLENHDQIANSLWSARAWQQSSPGCHRAMTALLLLGPWTPMLFQGQEWNASTPFHYFADHQGELAQKVRQGRCEFMSQFPGCAAGAGRDALPDPGAVATFERSRLRWDEREATAHGQMLRLHTDLLHLRRDDPTIRARATAEVSLEAVVLSPLCAMLRYFVDGPAADARAQDRLLLVNLGADMELMRPAEPLLAPPAEPKHGCWRTLWSSEDPRYGGYGYAEPESEERGWIIPGHAAVLLSPMPRI
jgi:maltooligosyltrehalose trehalohydrolase